MKSHWENLTIDTASGPSIPMRLYEGSKRVGLQPIILYLRGRAFLSASRDEDERPIGRALADTGAIVVEADYGSVSQNTFPQALECAFRALSWLAGRRKQFGGMKSPLFVAGDEAGGNVAAGVALKARDLLPGGLKGQMLFSPMIDPQMATSSFREADAVGMREQWSDGWGHYLGLHLGFQHPYAAPCLCSRLTGVAPALIVTSEDDPLRDEVVGYAERLKACGVTVRQQVFSTEWGWTSIYKEGTGKWLSPLQAEVSRFTA